jgi:predicted nucleotidyltransferase
MLALILLNADRTWTAPELARRLDATRVSIHRELQRALAAGVLTREALGRTFLYRAATESPLFEPLRLLLERTVGIESELRRALEDLPGVEAAFIYGSFARGTKIRPLSDVDVLVLGDVDYHVLRRRVREIERRVGREIDLLAFAPNEFAALARSGNGLARAILDGPVQPIVGSVDVLRRAA